MDTTDPVTNTIAQGSLISQLAGNLLLQTANDTTTMGDYAAIPKDNSWVKQSFLVTTDSSGKAMLDATQLYNRDFTSAVLKYTDASVGGNICINPPPQFTRYADIRVPGIHLQGPATVAAVQSYTPPTSVELGLSKTNYGMGRYYSEAIDDNNQIIHLRFGVPMYNSLTTFFTGFYDSGMATVARTGRISGGFITNFLTTTGTLIGLAIAPLFLIPMAIMLLSTAARFFLNAPPTKFYYLKPAMPVYWTAVTNMVNQIGTNMGLISYLDTNQSKSVMAGQVDNGITTGSGSTRTTQAGILSKYLDGVIRDDGLVDVKLLACRAKILEQKYQLIINEIIKGAGPSTVFKDVMRQAVQEARNNLSSVQSGKTLEQYLQLHADSLLGKGDDGASSSTSSSTTGSTSSTASSSSGASTEFDLRGEAAKLWDGTKDTAAAFANKVSSIADEVANYFVATLADGSDWASFRVDYTGSVQESFSSSTAPSSLAQRINGMSSSSREIRMNMADGNLAPGLGAAVDAVKEVAGGIADVLHLDGIAAMAGSAFVDIPDHWESSMASLPHSSYTMTLISPYGNPVSQMLHLWIPLSMILCGALPLATGAQSHTSPLLCELHDKGRTMTRLGIIDSVSVTRGAANLGFTKEGHCLAIDVSFTIKDLSSVMAVPAMPSFDVLNPLKGVFDSDNTYSDYLMTLASMPLGDVVYKYPILKYQVNRRIAEYKSALSPSNIGATLATLPGMSVLSAFMRGVDMQ